MFRMKISDTKTFKNVLNALSTIVDDATFTIGPDGIKLRSMDPSRVAMVDFEMRKVGFDEYEAAEESKICINLSDFLKLLKRAGSGDIIELSLDETTGNFLVKIMGRYMRTFIMPTLEASEEEVPEPRIEFNAKVTLATDDFNETLKDVALVSDNVRIETDGENLIMSAKGDIGGAKIEIKKGSDALLSLEAKEPSRATFSLSYLTEIVKAASATSDLVTLEFSTDMPIRLDFRQRYEGKLMYLLAPRIEVE